MKVLAILNPVRIYRKVMKIIFSMPSVRSKIEGELSKVKEEFLETYPKQHRSELKQIPYHVVEPKFGVDCEMESVKGYLSGSRYPDKKHSDFVANLAKEFSYSNPLHFDLHPYLKQMEVEVLKMCAKMVNLYGEKSSEDHKEVVGGLYSGGT